MPPSLGSFSYSEAYRPVLEQDYLSILPHAPSGQSPYVQDGPLVTSTAYLAASPVAYPSASQEAGLTGAVKPTWWDSSVPTPSSLDGSSFSCSHDLGGGASCSSPVDSCCSPQGWGMLIGLTSRHLVAFTSPFQDLSPSSPSS